MNKKMLLQFGLTGSGLLLALWYTLTNTPAYAAPQRTGGTVPQGTLAQVVIAPTKDNTLYESTTGDTSNGAGQYFFVGETSGASIRRGLLAFDLAGQLPANATVISVTLQLQMSRSSAGTTAVALHKVSAPWGEGTSDALSNEGKGASSTTNDATWIHRFYTASLWQAPGGDFVATPSATTSVAGVGLYTWASTPALVADVQSWLTTPGDNSGWIVIGDEGSAGTTKRFGTRENSDLTARPQLTIVYQTPSGTQQLLYLPLIAKQQ